MAAEPFLRPLDKARLAATQTQSDQAMKEALFKLGPNPTRKEFEQWVLRQHGPSLGSGAGRGDDESAFARALVQGAQQGKMGSLITIMRKYGLAGAAPMGALAAQDKYQQ